MSDPEATFCDVGYSIAEAEASRMFGKKCFKVGNGGTPSISFFTGLYGFKLKGDDHTQAMALEGAHLFDPSGKGRTMKEWVQVPYNHAPSWPSFSEAANRYVLSYKRFKTVP
jgi:hypothetical protein